MVEGRKFVVLFDVEVVLQSTDAQLLSQALGVTMSHRTATQLHIPALVLALREQEGVRSPLDLLLGFDVHVPVHVYAADLE